VDDSAIGCSDTLTIHQRPVHGSFPQAKLSRFFGVKLTRHIGEFTEENGHTIGVLKHFNPFCPWSFFSTICERHWTSRPIGAVKVEGTNRNVLITIDWKTEVPDCLQYIVCFHLNFLGMDMKPGTKHKVCE
jgi:hypothetical protein